MDMSSLSPQNVFSQNGYVFEKLTPAPGVSDQISPPPKDQASTGSAPGYSKTGSPPVSTDADNGQNTENSRQTSDDTGVSRVENGSPTSSADIVLTSVELQLVEKLQQVDKKVKAHEMAHMAAGGGLITSGASFTYQQGPDGKRYAVAGEVGINTSLVQGDPKATLQKMQQVKRAALAPMGPSPQDLKVTSQATIQESKALSELVMLQKEAQAATMEEGGSMYLKEALSAYLKAENSSGTDERVFELTA